MKHFGCILALIWVLPAVVLAEPYEVTYYPPGSPYLNGQDPAGPFPEDQGWDRYTRYGTVLRSVEDGALVLQAFENGDWEYYRKDMYDNLNPAPGEYLYVEWRMIVDDENIFGDTVVGVALDDLGGDFTLSIGIDHVRDAEGLEWYWYDPGVFHTFIVISVNLVDYSLFVDGEYAFSDIFKVPTSNNSFVGWGDGTTTYSSSRWQFFRLGVAGGGDIAVDGVIDLNDFATFAICFNGAGTTNIPFGCSDRDSALSDLDADGDVDLGDFATLAVNFGG